MTERGRNVVVGIFALLGLIVLAVLIVQFQAGVRYFRGTKDYYLEITADQTAAILPGQDVHLNGKRVGYIKSVELATDPREGVIIIASIDPKYDIPKDIEHVSIYQGQLGPPFIDIRVYSHHSSEMTEKKAGEISLRLKAKLPGGQLGELSKLARDIKPALAEFGEALNKIGALAESLNKILAGPQANGDSLSDGQDQQQVNLQNMLLQLSQTLENLNSLIGDEQTREDFKEGLSNLRQAGHDASEALVEVKGLAGEAKQTASELRTQFRDLAQALISNSHEISRLLEQLNKAAEQVNTGKGTAGKTLYDPALYEEMLTTTKTLNETLNSLQALLEKWDKQGVDLKLK